MGARPRVGHPPDEPDRAAGVLEGDLPAVGVLLAVAHVVREPVGQAGAAAAPLQDAPILLDLGLTDRVLRGENRLEAPTERALGHGAGDDRAGQPTREQPLDRERSSEPHIDGRVEQRDARDARDARGSFRPCQELLRHGRPVVVSHDRGLLDSQGAPQRLGQVGLLEDRVPVGARLVRVAEAEEVEAEHPEVPFEVGNDLRPVPRARREAVERR